MAGEGGSVNGGKGGSEVVGGDRRIALRATVIGPARVVGGHDGDEEGWVAGSWIRRVSIADAGGAVAEEVACEGGEDGGCAIRRRPNGVLPAGRGGYRK